MTGPPGSATRYRAFISYSHSDAAVATWLHHALETYRVPAKLVGGQTHLGPVPRRLHPIFRDRDELPASGDLGGELMAALRDSMFLVVICSPASARSRWVGEEVAAFKRLHGEGRVLALITDGVPNGSATAQSAHLECFPRSLRFRLGPDQEISDTPAEPIAADLRGEADGRRLASLKLIAGLTGLRLDDLVQRETQRRIRRLAVLSGASMAGMVLAGALALYANARRIEADQQRKIAETESAAARAASDYLIGTFELTNPATENPRTITALTILARGAARARTELADQPEMQARLLATLGGAYNNLGLFAEAQDALEKSMPAIRKAGPRGAEALLALANAYRSQGRFEEAMSTIHRLATVVGPNPAEHQALRALAAATEGHILYESGDPKGGLKALDRALKIYRTLADRQPLALADALKIRGLLLSDDGQFAAAEGSLNEALAIVRRVLGEHHRETGRAWYMLALNAQAAGNLAVAEHRVSRALAIRRRVLDNDNPILADSLSLQGQILQGEHRLDAAAAALNEAVAIYKKAYGRPHYMTGMAMLYLALVESDSQHTERALADIAEAKHNYDVGYGKLHPNHGDLLVNRATILAKAGRRAEAKADCASGIAILARTLGPDAAFTKSDAKICANL